MKNLLIIIFLLLLLLNSCGLENHDEFREKVKSSCSYIYLSDGGGVYLKSNLLFKNRYIVTLCRMCHDKVHNQEKKGG